MGPKNVHERNSPQPLARTPERRRGSRIRKDTPLAAIPERDQLGEAVQNRYQARAVQPIERTDRLLHDASTALDDVPRGGQRPTPESNPILA